ncbi:hypothetical protein ACIQ8G_26375 [Streptomyces sp. NPDC094154]|uniref:hypothetical protein n=1 Tax=Streptomyces sp. NPDC094154 TaxID=3366059 RepID=UPI0037F4AFDE
MSTMKSTTRPLFAALADAVRVLNEERGKTDEDAAAANHRLHAALADCLESIDGDFRLKPRVAPVRQGPAGVLAYLLYEADRLSRLVLALPRTRGVSPQDEAARSSLAFLLHAGDELSRIARRRSVEPHEGGRLTVFDELPFQSLRGLAPIALSMERVKTAKTRMERVERAEASGLLTAAEEEITRAVGEQELQFFIDRTRRRQRWAAPLWTAAAHVAAAQAEPAPPSLSEEHALIDRLETEAASSAGLDVEELSELRTRFEAGVDTLALEEQKTLRRAADRLARIAASTTRTMPQSRAAHLVNVYVTIPRETSERFTAEMAADILKAPDTARRTIDRSHAAREAAAEVASTLPSGKPQQMCEVDYLQFVRDQVAEALRGIGHRVQSKRMVILTPPVPDETSQVALQNLVQVFGNTCVLLGGVEDAAIRIPPPSRFGIQLRRARSCDCGRHPAPGPGGEER